MLRKYSREEVFLGALAVLAAVAEIYHALWKPAQVAWEPVLILLLLVSLTGYIPWFSTRLQNLLERIEQRVQERLERLDTKTKDLLDLQTARAIVLGRKKGRQQQYVLGSQLLKKPQIASIFLMQRSSTFLLGPEQCWTAEKEFFKSLLGTLSRGAEFLHIVCIDGLKKHLDRKASSFPTIPDALRRLSADSSGKIYMHGSGTQRYYLRKLDEEAKDLKPDKQARLLLVKYELDSTEGALVFDIGTEQSCFHLKGPEIDDYFDECARIYDNSPYLALADLEGIPQFKQHLRLITRDQLAA